MEYIDYKNIKLEDTGVYEPDKHLFGYYFEKYKITTVGQVLDDDLMKQFFYRFQIPSYVDCQLDGFRKLLKYKYLGITMNNDNFLEGILTDSSIFFPPYDYMWFSDIGISNDNVMRLKKIYEIMSQEKKKVTLLDILNEIANSEEWEKSNPVLYNVSKLNINSYNKSRNFLNDEHDTILQLKVKLFNLIEEKNKLDEQIQRFQQKLDELINHNNSIHK